MPESINILHISDMQFGKNHCFGRRNSSETLQSDIDCDQLLSRLREDLARLYHDHQIKPDVVAVTGDLAEWGQAAEFGQAHSFLVGLAEYLEISKDQRHRIAIIPGNHDVNRRGAEIEYLLWEEEGRLPTAAPFGFRRLENFAKMFELFYADVPQQIRPKFASDQEHTLFDLPEFCLSFAGLNSTRHECHFSDADAKKKIGENTQFGHHGYCGEAQMRWFQKQLQLRLEKNWLCVGLIHHNLTPSFLGDEECLLDEDAKLLNAVLGKSIHLLLHGHTHSGDHGNLKDGVPIFSTGTPSLGPDQKPPAIPNQYQLLRIEPSGVRAFMRAFRNNDRAFGPDGTRADDHTPGVKFRPFPFRELASSAFQPATVVGPTRGLIEVRHRGTGPDQSPVAITSPFQFPLSGANQSPQLRLLSDVASVVRVRDPKADIEARPDGMEGASLPYIRVTSKDTRRYAVGVVDTTSADSVEAKALFFSAAAEFSRIHANFCCGDPDAANCLVYVGPEQKREFPFAIWSLVEFMRIFDLRPFIEKQTVALRTDERYPSNLYLSEQQIRVYRSDQFTLNDERDTAADIPLYNHATKVVKHLLGIDAGEHDVGLVPGTLHRPNFLLIHGDFGTGKTFLLRQLALDLADSPVIQPIFIELRDLEKKTTLNELIGAALLKRIPQVDMDRIDYMRRNGLILLLFDGYDELVRTVTFEAADEYLDVLARSAGDKAKVILTVRSQHFLSDAKMTQNLVGRPGFQRLRLEKFDDQLIRMFLTKKLGNKDGPKHYAVLDRVKDMLGLSKNPRMLSFIADIRYESLEKAALDQREPNGEPSITAGILYQLIINQWLDHEIERRPNNTRSPQERLIRLWRALDRLALAAWPRPNRILTEADMENAAEATLEELAQTNLARASSNNDKLIEGQSLASGSLISREGDGRFIFGHQSLLEWLVAHHIASAWNPKNVLSCASKAAKATRSARNSNSSAIEQQLPGNCNDDLLAHHRITPLLAEFLIDLATEQTVEHFALAILLKENSKGSFSKPNALLLRSAVSKRRAKRGEAGIGRQPLDFSNQDLRGHNFDDGDFSGDKFVGCMLSGSSFVGANFHGANLTAANMQGANLSKADLRNTNLTNALLNGANLTDASLSNADLTDADLSRACLEGADLKDAKLFRTAGTWTGWRGRS